MKQVELVDKRVPRKLQEPFAEPVFGTVQPISFTRFSINPAVWQLV